MGNTLLLICDPNQQMERIKNSVSDSLSHQPTLWLSFHLQVAVPNHTGYSTVPKAWDLLKLPYPYAVFSSTATKASTSFLLADLPSNIWSGIDLASEQNQSQYKTKAV
jgi:hypothetical protein